jgi:FkbM family methyltransferase
MSWLMRNFLIMTPALLILPFLKLWSWITGMILFEYNIVDRRIRWSKIYSAVLAKIKNQTQQVVHVNSNGNEIKLEFFIPSAICKMRVDTFSSKEPEILKWIDQFGGGVFWDIGANIGLYSIYYAKNYKQPVIAFEPSVFNTSELVRNLNINCVADAVQVVPNPLTSKTAMETFRLSSYEEGGAENAFGVTFGDDGTDHKTELTYDLLGFSAFELIKNGYLKQYPNLVKIDVDGIEHLILEGMEDILKSEACESVFIEVNDHFLDQSLTVAKILTRCGFRRTEKTHSNIMSKSNTDNEIWFKSEIL